MPRPRKLPGARRHARAAGPVHGCHVAALQIVLLLLELVLYFYCKIVLFQGLLSLPPEVSGFKALAVSVTTLHVVLCVLWPQRDH